MKLWRGITLTEAAILFETGKVSAETFPEGAIQVGETCDDTTPPPPPGVFCFFEGEKEPSLTWRFGEPICIEVPESRIVWRGTGKYELYDRFTDSPSVVYYEREAGVAGYCLDDIIAIPSRDAWIRLAELYPEDIELGMKYGWDYIETVWTGILEKVPAHYRDVVCRYLFRYGERG